MRKIILSVAISLDGFIEGPNGEYDWCPPPSKKEMDDFLKNIDIIFMGRKSYEMAGEFMIPEKFTYVFSNKLKQVRGKNVKLLSGDVLKEVEVIRKQKGKDIWLWGGANLTTTFINQNLVCDWKVGSPILFKGEWEGKPYEDKGTVLEFEREKLLKYSYWSNFSGEPDIPENYHIVSYILKKGDGKTRLTITQGNCKTEESREHSEKNWTMVLDTMKKMLE